MSSDFSKLTNRQLALRLNTMFVDAGKNSNRADVGNDVDRQPSKTAQWVSRALIAEDRVSRLGKEDKLTVNEKLLLALHDDETRIGWSSREWANFLGCSHSAIKQCPIWNTFLALQAGQRESAQDKRNAVTRK